MRVDQFPVGSVLINELMTRLMEEVMQQAVLKVKLYQVRPALHKPTSCSSHCNTGQLSTSGPHDTNERRPQQ